MTCYRFLRLNQAGQVANFSTHNATTDDAALAAARHWAGEGRSVEVWRDAKLVGTVTAPGKSTSLAA